MPELILAAVFSYFLMMGCAHVCYAIMHAYWHLERAADRRAGRVLGSGGDEMTEMTKLTTADPEAKKRMMSLLAAREEELDLDEEVHELKSQEAAAINNQGTEAQIEYLLENHGEEYLKKLLDS